MTCDPQRKTVSPLGWSAGGAGGGCVSGVGVGLGVTQLPVTWMVIVRTSWVPSRRSTSSVWVSELQRQTWSEPVPGTSAPS